MWQAHLVSKVKPLMCWLSFLLLQLYIPSFLFPLFTSFLRKRLSERPLRSEFPGPVGETLIKNSNDWMFFRWSLSQIMNVPNVTRVMWKRLCLTWLIHSGRWLENDAHTRYYGAWKAQRLFCFCVLCTYQLIVPGTLGHAIDRCISVKHSNTNQKMSKAVITWLASHYLFLSWTPATNNPALFRLIISSCRWSFFSCLGLKGSSALPDWTQASVSWKEARFHRPSHWLCIQQHNTSSRRRTLLFKRSEFFVTKSEGEFFQTSLVYISFHQAYFHLHLEHMKLMFQNATVWKTENTR